MPGLPVHHQLPESTQTHFHWVSDAIQPFHPLSSPFPPALNLSQHQGLFKWVRSSHQVAKVLEFQLQHQSLQWTPRTDLVMNKYLRVNWSHSILSAYTFKVEVFFQKVIIHPKTVNTQRKIRLMKSQGKYPDLKGASISSFCCLFSRIKQKM